MGNREVKLTVDGWNIRRSGSTAGVMGEGNATALVIQFDESWDGFAKKVTFWDALGQNAVEITLTADKLVDLASDTRTYSVLIPAEPLAVEGDFSLVIDGYADGVRARSVAVALSVKYAPITDTAGEPADPTPSQAEQLQVQIDTLLGDMSEQARLAQDSAAESVVKAGEAAQSAQVAQESASAAAQAASLSTAANTAAQSAKTAAQSAQMGAEQARAAAETAQAAAQGYSALASQSETVAQAGAESAGLSAGAAVASAAAAQMSAQDASTAATAASVHASAAGQSAQASQDNEDAAQDAAQDAETAKAAAVAAQAEAGAAAVNAQNEADRAKKEADRAQEYVSIHDTDAQAHSELFRTTGKRTARFIVGTSAAGWTEKDCDYLCDGTDDQVEINAAIQALPTSGGEVVILAGTYNITAKIDVNRVMIMLVGNGPATVLKRMWRSTAAEGVVHVSSSNCVVANLTVDGNLSNFNSNNNAGIFLLGSKNTATGNICTNNNVGIYLYGNENTATGNISSNNITGIQFGGTNGTVTGNTCNSNGTYGIYLNGSYGTVTGNTCNSGGCGIYLLGKCFTITGNTCRENLSCGIYLNGSLSTITGNTCIRGTGLSSDYQSFQNTILLAATRAVYNLVASNNIMGKNYVDEGGSDNTIVNNKFE